MVDDPYDFGAIAAANALSDIYAMGGEVLFAINLVAFPDNLGSEILQEILRGGAEKVAEAGAVVVGGHSVNDREPKYGLAVTGIVHPDRVKIRGNVSVGDVLVLTKPLGVGVITTALKQQRASEEHVAAAVKSMKELNKQAAIAAQSASATAITDVTGFGILGHALEMARQSDVSLRLLLDKLPWLPGAIEYGEKRAFPAGMGNNMRYFADWVRFGTGVNATMQDLLFTPETSGGLLVCLAPNDVGDFMASVPAAVVVGEAVEGTGLIHVY